MDTSLWHMTTRNGWQRWAPPQSGAWTVGQESVCPVTHAQVEEELPSVGSASNSKDITNGQRGAGVA